MNKGITFIVVGLCALGCLVLTFFMPVAELMNPGNATIPAWFRGLTANTALFEAVKQEVAKDFLQVSQYENFQYYVYAFFLGLALIAAAIAINAVGREDSEEKTVLPLK